MKSYLHYCFTLSTDCIKAGTKIWAKWYSMKDKTFYFHGFVTDVRPNSLQVSPTGDHGTLRNLLERSRAQQYNFLVDRPPRKNELAGGARVIALVKEENLYSTGTITNRFHSWYEIQMDGGKKFYQEMKYIRAMKAPSYCEEV